MMNVGELKRHLEIEGMADRDSMPVYIEIRGRRVRANVISTEWEDNQLILKSVDIER